MTLFTAFAGRCWRAVPTMREASVIAGTTRDGRYNRAGEPTLYTSGSRAGVAAAMTRYGEAARTVVPLEVASERLVDLRDPATCAALHLADDWAGGDWRAALERGEEPLSWRIADAVRGIGADGLIERSRRAPALWHLVLFRWNVPHGAVVDVAEGASREQVP